MTAAFRAPATAALPRRPRPPLPQPQMTLWRRSSLPPRLRRRLGRERGAAGDRERTWRGGGGAAVDRQRLSAAAERAAAARRRGRRQVRARRLFLLGIALFAVASAVRAGPFAAAAAGRPRVAGRRVGDADAEQPGAARRRVRGEARGRAIGTWAAAGAIAGAIGPVLGGWLVGSVGLARDLPHQPAALRGRFVARLALCRREPARGNEAPLDWARRGGRDGGAGRADLGPDGAVGRGRRPAAGLDRRGRGDRDARVRLIERRRGERAIMPLAMFGRRASSASPSSPSSWVFVAGSWGCRMSASRPCSMR
jgi:hypothetical protein